MTLPVLIVGAGPVGLTLASELHRYGVPFRIVDKAAQRTDKSKALVLWSRTLELLDRGIGASRFIEAGFRATGVTFAEGDKVVAHVPFDKVASPYSYGLMIPQSDTERLLEEYLEEQGVKVERATEATAFDFRADGVTSELRGAAGQVEKVDAQWVVGCDGAHSVVRHALSASFQGATNPSDWMLADVHMTGYPRPDSDMSIYWHRDGVLVILPITPGHYRIIADVPASGAEHPATLTLEQMQAIVDRRGPTGTRLFDPVWLSGFRINARKVHDYRHGRVFLAGDAAHVHSPAGGQGMNTGMQDVFNLSWKLALVIHGICREGLLDSYSPERSVVGDKVLKSASLLTTIGTLRNPILQSLRNLLGRAVLNTHRVSQAIAKTMTEVDINYANSPLNGAAAKRGPHPGERMAPVPGDIPFGAGSKPVFTLCGVPSADLTALAERFPDLVDSTLRAPIDNNTISLIRPDGYLLASSATVADIAAKLNDIQHRP
jgi:2-polyprenyl-6-methoxyphenol hydroxylase-like FAD-dependent oxidoreductase